MTAAPRIVGVGYEVPANKRGNDDPIFDWLKEHNPAGSNLFRGYVDRRVLAFGENLMTIMVPASLRALRAAAVAPGEIDLLIGYASVSSFETPNELGRLHQQLGLSPSAWIIPINAEFSNFNAAVATASSMIDAGLAKKALVAIGGNWTRHVDYHTAQSVSASDGAAAAVITRSDDLSCFRVVDAATITDSQYFGTMTMNGDAYEQCPERDRHRVLFSSPYFHITQAGLDGFQTFGVQTAPQSALQVMAKHGLSGPDITLISHQASAVLIDAWRQVIQPAQYIQTIEQFGNMTLANIPVNLAWAADHEHVSKDSMVWLSVGSEQHANSLLLQRGVR